MPNVPIKNDGLLYVNGLELAWTADETISVAAGAARDSSNVNDIVLDAAVSVSNIVNGANGLDTGSVANSTMYAVYLIGSSTGNQSTAGILTLASNASPALPFGYDMSRRIGWVLTDGTADNLLFWQSGAGQQRQYFYDAGISELASGTSTSYVALDLATSVPPIATEVTFIATYTPNSATNIAHFIPSGSAATTGVVQIGCGVAAAQTVMVVVPARLDTGVAVIEYKVQTSDDLDLATAGFIDYL